MRRVEWDSSLETGQSAVDAQHQALVQLFNQLIDAENAADEGDAHEALERLTEYVLVHFSAEETLMEQYGYPNERIADHVAEHSRLTETTRDLVLDYRAGRLTTLEPIVQVLYAWLTEHIEHSDRALVEFMRRSS